MYENQIAKSLTGPLYNPLGDENYQTWLQKQQYQQMPQQPGQASPIGQQLTNAAYQPATNTMPTSQWHGNNQPQVGVPTTGGADISQGQQEATKTATQTAAATGVQTGDKTPTGEFFSHSRLGNADAEKGISLATSLLLPSLAPTVTAGIGLAELAYQGGKWLYNKFNSTPDAPGPGQDMSKSPYSNYGNWYDQYQASHPDQNNAQPEGTPTDYTTGSGTTYTPTTSTQTSQWHSSETNGGYNNAGESDSTSSDTG